MNFSKTRLTAFATGAAWLVLAAASARADDTELFVANAAVMSQARPNVLLILDDSGSMGGLVTSQINYDPTFTYAGTCDVNRVYWSTNGRPPTDCTTDDWFNLTAFKCQRAIDTFLLPQGGLYTDNMAQFDPGDQDRWERIASAEKNRLVECQDDRPNLPTWPGHGDGSSATLVYAQNGNQAAPWAGSQANEIAWGQMPADRTYTVFSGNFMNYLYSPGTTVTRMQIMQDVAANLVNSVNGVNFGLMNFNLNSNGELDGGLITHAVEDVATGRADMLAAINSLAVDGNTPLSETLYEAFQYVSGGSVVNGMAGDPAAQSGGIYTSPISFECQKTHVVLLTDGEPTNDDDLDSTITGLSDLNGDSFTTLTGGGTCDVETYPAGLAPSGGDCLDELAEFMYDGDMSSLPGPQSVTTHTIGFLIDLPLLEDTAARGGGEYYTAEDTTSLTTALTNIITNILDTQATFTAPAMGVNAFNQTRNLDDLYFSLFRPTGTTHWPGNLKKYRLRASDATIVDALGNPAIDPGTGFFDPNARSFWTAGITADGDDIEAGGAANLIPDPRNVYTYLTASPNPALPANRVDAANMAIDDGVLNTGVPGEPTRDEVLDFINGLDASDVDQDNDLDEPRNQMGDPLHSQPVTVIYGPTTDDALIFFATNDGYLHAIDTLTGVEQWAFLPEEFLPNQVELFKDNQTGTGTKVYGIDGSLRLQMVGDTDGIVEPGERVYLFFGMRRGGDVYYALDVTNPAAPEVMWRLDSDALLGAGQSWSSATPARINVSPAQSPDKLVLVLGGGYDTNQDAPVQTTDTMGNAIYIVDSETGALLWHGGPAGQSPSQNKAFADMLYSIPGDVRVIDLNGDRFADRMYASDMGGQVWRFDVFNAPADPDLLVNGGVIATLGAAGLGMPTLAETRRFYYAPDVALVSNDDYSFIHVGIGSGYRAHPNETDNQNRFYALRDYDTFNALTQAEYDAIAADPITDGDLVDVTTDLTASVPQGSPGWKLLLSDGGWRGEKVLAETRTFNNQVYVTTFRPGGGIGCEPSLGTNRQYIMSLFTGAPVTNLDNSLDPDNLTLTDRYVEFQGAPPPETVFIFAEDPACVGGQCPPVACVDVNCGLTNFPNNPIRTFWSQESID